MYQKVLELEEDVLKILANQKRLEILQLLKNRELSVNQMVEMLGLRQPNLSQHLTLLRQHQLVKVNKRGRQVYYGLADNKITKAVNMIYQFLQERHGFHEEFPAVILFPIVRDPVCGMRLSSAEAYASAKYGAQSYYFCASGCHRRFLAKPGYYVKTKEEVKA